MLEYYEEVEYKDFTAEKYNLVGVYLSEREAQKAKANIALRMGINENYFFVSEPIMGEVQWDGGFVSV